MTSITPSSLSAHQLQEMLPTLPKEWNDHCLDIIASMSRMNCDRYNVLFQNVFEEMVQILARHALVLLPQSVSVCSKVTLSCWHREGNEARRKKTVSYQIHTLMQGILETRNISKEVFCGSKPRWVLKSSNFPHLTHPDLYLAEDIICYFRGSILATAPSYPNVKAIEWRFEGLSSYKKKEIDGAMQQLTSMGFCVHLQPTFVVVTNESGEMDLRARQSLSVRIPQEAVIPEGAQFEGRGLYTFSVHNVLVACQRRKEKKSLLLHFTHSDEEVFGQIFKELAFLARKGSLVRRYAFSIVGIEVNQQRRIQTKLEELGYRVTIDVPFIDERFVGVVHGGSCSYLKHYLYIDF